ncbi:hypothetical protein CAEBREN_25220 [Caenorhabditis brenneri]|uniref:Uncharacterized protein n=1 Tax=Caenorhabditis brenneri TaxID=135651 RepID=G0NSS5_CAEBE|nr:hypothetical protein CAEBREN_25220 [Caenorhabditis brenneri]
MATRWHQVDRESANFDQGRNADGPGPSTSSGHRGSPPEWLSAEST